MLRSNRAHDPGRRRHDPGLELSWRQASRPRVEDLQHIGAGLGLHREIVDRGLDQDLDQPGEARSVAIGPQPRVGLVGRAPPADHVGRHGPRRAAKSDKGRLTGEVLSEPGNRLANAGELGASCGPAQAHEIGLCANRVEPRPVAVDERDALAQRIGHHQDVGEQDRRVEAVAPDRLQRHFCGKGWIVAEVEKAPGLRPHRPVFRQVAAGLPHQPDRRWRQGPSGEGLQEAARFGRIGGHHELPISRIQSSERCCYELLGAELR